MINHINRRHFAVPKNINIWYCFGILALVTATILLVSGVWLATHYIPSAKDAYISIQFIVQNTKYGWLVHPTHAIGTSLFFALLYLHLFRGLLYGSYQQPRKMLWVVGMLMFMLIMAEAYTGQLLSWDSESYWGVHELAVIFENVPLIGNDLATWIRGDTTVSSATLHRFFALHIIALPLVLVVFMALHFISLREFGLNNPDGVEIKDNNNEQGFPVDGKPFSPFYLIKSLQAIFLFLVLFAAMIYFVDVDWLEITNKPFESVALSKSSQYYKPQWYFSPFFAIFSAIPNKLCGLLVLLAANIMLLLLPWVDRCSVKSIRYRSRTHKINIFLFAITFIVLGFLGMQHSSPLILKQLFTLLYFSFFLFLWPL